MKIFFASDQHFGAPSPAKSKEREVLFVKWLDEIKNEATALFLLGDLFDFWFEYKKVVPKGFVRVLGKLAELQDNGVAIHFFIGNHDLWMKGYFEKELGIKVYKEPTEFTFNNKAFLIGHGDGLGPGDKGYKFLKKIFTNPIANWLFQWMHPNIGMGFAEYLSLKNKLISGDEDIKFLGEDKEDLILYIKAIQEKTPHDYYIFGHRHLPLEIPILPQSKYFNTGDWIQYNSYVVFDGTKLSLKYYTN